MRVSFDVIRLDTTFCEGFLDSVRYRLQLPVRPAGAQEKEIRKACQASQVQNHDIPRFLGQGGLDSQPQLRSYGLEYQCVFTQSPSL